MTKVTDRIGNQDIINLARQQYDKKQKSKLPSVVVQLASKGRVYPTTHPLSDGTIEMRHMTAYDEDILTNASYIREQILFDKLLEALIVTPVAISDIAPCDKDALIIQARILAYGPDYPVLIQSPKTGKQLERVVKLDQLKYKDIDWQSDTEGEIIYQVSDQTTIKYSYLAYNISTNSTVSELLSQIITQVNDTRSVTEIEDFIRYDFLSRDAKPFRTHVINNVPGLITSYDFEDENGDVFQATFPIGTDLFWF